MNEVPGITIGDHPRELHRGEGICSGCRIDGPSAPDGDAITTIQADDEARAFWDRATEMVGQNDDVKRKFTGLSIHASMVAAAAAAIRYQARRQRKP